MGLNWKYILIYWICYNYGDLNIIAMIKTHALHYFKHIFLNPVFCIMLGYNYIHNKF